MLQVEFIASNNIDSVLSIIDPQRAGIVETYHAYLTAQRVIAKSIYFYDVCDEDCRLSPSFKSYANFSENKLVPVKFKCSAL
jgi:hypothetical protein